MSYIPPHKQGQAKPTGPIMRAVMLDVALCLLGVALYLQTKLIALPIGCALIGSVIVISAVLQKRKANASAPVRRHAQRPAAPRAPRAPASTNDSNVIEFKRKTGRKSGRSGDDNQKSNWPSA
jgi:uncharacterized iron-regulated membrane protein